MTKLADYGIVLLTHMAMEAPGTLHTAQDLAGKSRVPVPTASKLLKSLARAGLVVSHRGRNGGYGLARDAEEISVADIIAAIEGPIGLTECGTGTEGACDMEPFCAAKGRWAPINQAVERALRDVRLSAMRPQAGPLVRLQAESGVVR
ncbi:MAG TPA: SUF system Fe-S cluster assembly regulator [Anaeromyxobacteraceae bacterium]|nr:SUF system Fe-S cluster assembly regulator [Anaeromyxobacteraceae bacterium]